MPVIEHTFNGTTAQAGQVFSIAIGSFTAAVLVIPRLAPVAQSLFVSGAIGLVGAGCLSIASFATHYWQFLGFFSIGFGFVSGALYINVLTLASVTDHARWLTPVMVAAFGLGGVVFGPLWRQLAALDWGLQSILPLACLIVLCSVWALVVDRRASTMLSLSLFKRRSTSQRTVKIHSDAPPSGDRRRVLLLWCIFATGSMAGLMVLGLASKIIEHAGGTVKTASVGIAGIALGNTLGRLSVSVQLFFIGSTMVALLATLIIATGLVIVSTEAGAGSIASGLTLVALGYGIMASAIPVIVQRQFGTVNFSNRYSVIFTAWGLAGLASPWMAGVLFDRSGSFSSAVSVAMGITMLCTCLLVGLAITDRLGSR